MYPAWGLTGFRRGPWFPPFAKDAKNGAPAFLALSASSKAGPTARWVVRTVSSGLSRLRVRSVLARLKACPDTKLTV
jgi:hypothetical protein